MFSNSHLFSKVLSAVHVKEIEHLFDLKLSLYWQDHYVFDKPSTRRNKTIGKQAIYHILINGIIPFLFLYGKEHDDRIYLEKAQAFLEALKAENNRVISGWMWPLYLILLVCVELHASIGLYRLCMKWGWFTGKDARKSREKLKKFKTRATIFFLSIGVLSLLVFAVIGINHRDKVGERYTSHSAAVEAVVEEAAAPVHEDEAAAGNDEDAHEEPVNHE